MRFGPPTMWCSVAALLSVIGAVGSCEPDHSPIMGAPHAAGPTAVLRSPSTVTINPTADTYLNIDAMVHAPEESLNVYTWPDDKIANAIVMKFDLSTIPPGSAISSATLNLYLRKTDATSDPTYTVAVHKVVNKNPVIASATGSTYDGVNSWTPNSCCYNNVPLAQADIGPAVDTKSIDKTLGFKQWDVTAIVQDWFAHPSSNFGLLVNSDPTKVADRFRQFSSSENPETSQRPYLTVVYTPNPVLFLSEWTTALGATDAALRDVNSPTPWTLWNDNSGGSLLNGAHIMEVVDNAFPPGYTRSLRVQQRGSSPSADVRKDTAIATANIDYYLRYYFMTNDTGGTYQDHGVEPWTGRSPPQYNDLTYLDKNETASGWGLRLTIGDYEDNTEPCFSHGGRYPFVNWNLRGGDANNLPNPVLAYNTWYRLEYWVHFDSASHVQVHPRIYSANGVLLYADGDFFQSGYGTQDGCSGTGPKGDWTLELWYTRIVAGCNPRGDFYIDQTPAPDQHTATTLQGLLMGNNGSLSSNSTGLFWYYAGVKICADTWCGL